MIGRIAVLDVRPVVDGGAFPARAAVGEVLPVEATVFREGHGLVGATAVASGPCGRERRVRMELVDAGVDRHAGLVRIDAVGAWTLRVEGWADPFETWRRGTIAKIEAGVNATLDFEGGARLLERAVLGLPAGRRGALTSAITRLRDELASDRDRVAMAAHPSLAELLWNHPLRELVTSTPAYPLWVDRVRATFATWYEFFPRSEGGLRSAADRLAPIAAMGFDVVYLPPVHPIGHAFRKGRNNTLHARPEDPGSPWAIGSQDGGHDALDPGLGTFEDFDAFVAQAQSLGLEIALDLALQCSPDHPWVTTHPDWFAHRSDGSIAYAENPPKAYQDIYPLDFDTDPESIRAEMLRIVRLWMEHGVRIFRVDNPHTKPVAFWQWLIAEVKSRDPDVLFLAEAFTRPPMMHTLAKVGFTQSYTYFTWRNSKSDLEQYLTDLSTSPTADYMRPCLWPNTPDILPLSLQLADAAAFKIRAVLAATLSPSYGIYSGYELGENRPLRAGSEEYLDSEKYQLRPRNWAAAEAAGGSLAPYLTQLNAVRRAHPALQWLRGLHFHVTDDDAIIAYSRQAAGHPTDVVIAVVNLDPHSVRETTVHLDLGALGWEPSATLLVHDQLGDRVTHTWGAHNYVRLDPASEPAHLFVVEGP